jgi:hypothetical protein
VVGKAETRVRGEVQSTLELWLDDMRRELWGVAKQKPSPSVSSIFLETGDVDPGPSVRSLVALLDGDFASAASEASEGEAISSALGEGPGA